VFQVGTSDSEDAKDGETLISANRIHGGASVKMPVPRGWQPIYSQAPVLSIL
jgi:hypothetical protein